MHLTHLALRNFRNYADAELTLVPGLTVFRGANGQGKSNLLEAVAMLALT
ncbi:MAG: AAA family ATPase, partial [Chloroflexota bacterium]|nr:AAA family ATPase [Chloroflexota bacterium]